MPIDASAVEKAYLVKKPDENDASKRVQLHFNPVSLSYSVEASSSQQNQPNRTGQTQHASPYSAKLSFDAIFDNSDTGEDVRLTTSWISACLAPSPAQDSGSTPDSGVGAPPQLVFHWGAFRFEGVLNQYKETIDFFSKEGVPLRSAVSLTLLEQLKTLPTDTPPPKSKKTGPLVPTKSSDSALSAATRGGNPAAARALAAANGLENLRFTDGATLQISAPVTAKASAGFVAGGGVSADASASWNASGSGSLFGGQSSAGVSAGAGAFAGISASSPSGASVSLNPSTMLAAGTTADVSATAGASFSIGGGATLSAGVGLTADVGTQVSWKDLLEFDDES